MTGHKLPNIKTVQSRFVGKRFKISDFFGAIIDGSKWIPFSQTTTWNIVRLPHLNWTFPNSQSVADHFRARLLKHLSADSVDVATQMVLV